jgi:hypothetical protein
MNYPKDQVAVIDCYFEGVNGWTYSHTLLNAEDVPAFDTSDTYRDMYLSRVLELDPMPQYHLLKRSGHDTIQAQDMNGEYLYPTEEQLA